MINLVKYFNRIFLEVKIKKNPINLALWISFIDVTVKTKFIEVQECVSENPYWTFILFLPFLEEELY